MFKIILMDKKSLFNDLFLWILICHSEINLGKKQTKKKKTNKNRPLKYLLIKKNLKKWCYIFSLLNNIFKKFDVKMH